MVETEAISQGQQLLSEGQLEASLNQFKRLAETSPTDLTVQSYINLVETLLLRHYMDVFPSLQAVPLINPRFTDRITQLELEGNEGYLLTQIDGSTTIKSLIFIGGMGKFRTLRILNKLLLEDIIQVKQ